MAKVVFREERCKGCYLCMDVCPKKIIVVAEDRMNAKGFRPVEVLKMDECLGCAMCATMCPDCVIEVFK
ncbi:MAG: 4Fe-4S dicluster domain-containing protein [Clostridia bacterium]|nr:4Fe-4S dicluster domain-containing protein [Clostridia bacterium]MBQ3553796.1 4Fe-4S dicluster domain-containing protein [Clostridia bacterium]